MASSRAASVASRSSSPDPLTPRSKIRALLATVESSDEEGGPTVNPTRPSFLHGNGKHRAHDNSSPSPVHDDDSDDAMTLMNRPRGKLASRMQGAQDVTKGTKSPEPTAATARDRVRAMLERDQAEIDDGEGPTDQDEDEDLPTVPRHQRRPAAAADTQLDDSEADERTRPASPGLFVSSPMRPSPRKNTERIDESDDSDNDLPALKSDRFQLLVERKRQERLAREAAEEVRKAERWAQQEKLNSEMELIASDDGDIGITDDEGGRRLTQQARPTRKASKKAIEEMNRETQRMTRNMQLAPEIKTKTKISKSSLFQRFNYKPTGYTEPEPELQTHSSSRPTTPHSDIEMNDAGTPPSSPPVLNENAKTATTNSTASNALARDSFHGLRENRDRFGQQQSSGPGQKQMQKQTRRVRIKLPVVPINSMMDSDDELQITTTTKNKLDALFDSIPSKRNSEPNSIHALRALAMVTSPAKDRSRKADQSKMTPGELQAYLHFKARQQAKMERERRLEILRGQGIVVQTVEEREQQEREVEDLVAKARLEAHKIKETEQDEARRQGKAKGEVDPLAWDDSEDEEYRDVAEEDAAEMEISGSEIDEMDEEAEEEQGQDENAAGHALFDDEAESAVSEHEAQEEEDDDDDERVVARPAARQRRARKTTTVLSDDEDSVGVTPKPFKLSSRMTPAGVRALSPSPDAPNSVLRSAKKTFIPGLPVKGPAGLGLTQIFAGTMDNSQTNNFAGTVPTQSMMPDFSQFPDSNFSATADEPMEDMVANSQRLHDSLAPTQAVQFNLSQSQMHGLGSLITDEMQTQLSEGMEYSQDMGLQQHTPLRERFIEPPFSTAETLPAEHPDGQQYYTATVQDSPLVRKGRLRRRMDMSTAAEAGGDADAPSAQADAFEALRGGAAAANKESRKSLAVDDFDRKKSKAKGLVEEQAEESDDEYAGIGGVDGEDSDDESNGSVKDMINDAAGNDVDERKLAAFYADQERAQDEKQVEKLFKDLSKGMLRRKRGADFDLSDSDSDGEARKRMKRRQFAKMQKALFSDERVKKIAENPGNQAFLRSIEDHGSDVDDVDILDGSDSPSQTNVDSQQAQDDDDKENQTQGASSAVIPDSQAHASRGPSMGLSENHSFRAHPRRSKGGKKPSHIGQVRETLSSLLDERYGSVIPATETTSDTEDEDEDEDDNADPSSSNKENQAPRPIPPPPPFHRLPTAPPTIVNRIGAMRRSSSNSNSSSSTRMAFATPSAISSCPSFKVPPLLRRATTNSSFANASASGAGAEIGTAGGFGEAAKIKKGAGKKSGIGGFARENASRSKVLVRESERRREERKVRGAERRVGMVGGLLGRGAFE
ncbi:hypothetical protein E4U57_003480 [Claviceps arundinis]|uniref:DNA replication checkpoint mediator MRC1 domain-containing protein n=1 Tax=Claviceps arundinis TaxID=1623583 RepID=A0ABQ7PJM7_9HYPO|nr:hypothetical protein E4U57_003480 [Claviceps arundinis]